MFPIHLTEPLRGQQLMTYINTRASSDPSLFHIISILADIFVFTYPVLLIGLFLYGFIKKKSEYQSGAISILTSSIVAIAINIFIQLFIIKDRPESLPGLKLILSHVPTVSFPSDHAAVSMAVAVGFFIRTKAHKGEQKKFISFFAFLLFCFSLVMGFCRVAVAIHWPTDVIAGWIIGIIGGRIGYSSCQTQTGKKSIDRIINISSALLQFMTPKSFK